jgi:hypothetical protein
MHPFRLGSTTSGEGNSEHCRFEHMCPGAEEAATAWAEANNGITIWDTPFGEAFEDGSLSAEEASEGYANSASGQVQVFSNDPLTNYGNIWYNTELPTVANNPNVTGLSFHAFP